MAEILIVEDEKNISDLIKDTISLAHYEYDCSYDGEDALSKIKENKYDLILLDIMLPKIDGFEIIEKIKTIDTPIIFLSAKNDVNSIVKGLKGGGIDYITKPFEPLELLARIELRISKTKENIHKFKNITVNLDTREVSKDEEKICLAPKEYDLLILILNNKNKVLSRDEILDKVWNIETDVETRTVDYHIQQLRKKLDLKENLITIHGVGYILK